VNPLIHAEVAAARAADRDRAQRRRTVTTLFRRHPDQASGL
jgi:hypothetical protein